MKISLSQDERASFVRALAQHLAVDCPRCIKENCLAHKILAALQQGIGVQIPEREDQ